MTFSPSTQLVKFTASLLEQICRSNIPADTQLSFAFKNKPAYRSKGLSRFNAVERTFIADAIYGILRQKAQLSFWAGTINGTKLVSLWLRNHEKYQFDDSPLQKIDNEDTANMPLDVQANLPLWLWTKLAYQYGEIRALEIAKTLASSANLDLRVNTLKTTRDEVLQKLNCFTSSAEATPFSPCGIRIKSHLAINKHILFQEGMIEVQDEGSQLIALFLEPKKGERIADFCAGAGGKTLAIGALMKNTGQIYAMDNHESRLQRLKVRLARSGLSNVYSQYIQNERDSKLKRYRQKFDRVLVDVPCSGTGTFRRNPDLKWRIQESDLDNLVSTQKAILAQAEKLVKPKGRLIYATCSFLQEENEAIIQDFLAIHPNYKIVSMADIVAKLGIKLDVEDFLKLLPDQHQTDGFFMGILEKLD